MALVVKNTGCFSRVIAFGSPKLHWSLKTASNSTFKPHSLFGLLPSLMWYTPMHVGDGERREGESKRKRKKRRKKKKKRNLKPSAHRGV